MGFDGDLRDAVMGIGQSYDEFKLERDVSAIATLDFAHLLCRVGQSAGHFADASLIPH